MKKLIILLAITLVGFTSCKKEPLCEPEIVEKIVTVKGKDSIITIHDTIKVRDSIFVNNPPLPIVGMWKCWKVEDYNTSGVLTSSSLKSWEFLFSADSVRQDLKSSGIYTYKVTYLTGYLDIKYTPTNIKSYYQDVLNYGNEWKLTTYNGSAKQVWFLKK